MKSNLYIPLLLLAGVTTTQAQTQKDTIWVGYSDQVINKTEATYYKFVVPKKDKAFEVTKYTRANVLFSKGIATNSESPSNYNGKVNVYDQKGQLLNTFEYVNGVLEGKAISILNGTTFEALYKEDQLFDGTVIYEYEDVYTSMESTQGEVKKAKLFSNTPNKHRQIVYFTANTVTKEETYDGSDQLIASCSYADFTIIEGKHVDFYFSPFQIKSISEHANSALTKKNSYFRTGELKETQVTSGQKNTYTFYDKTGKTIGIYNEQMDPEEYTTISDGTRVLYNTATGKEDLIESIYIYKNTELSELHEFYNDGILKQITHYKESYYPEKIINFDKKGKAESELIYDEDGTPLNGTEKADNYTRVYQDKILISESQIYSNGALFKKYSDFKATFYDTKGKQIGLAKFDPKTKYSYYSTPIEGVLLTIDDKDLITDSNTYKSGKLINSTTFVEHKGKAVKTQELIYDNNEYKISETKYHNNGKVLSQSSYVNYELAQSSFYDDKGTLLGKYDYLQTDGTLYTFFDSKNEIQSISKYVKGDLTYKKKYNKANYLFADDSKIYLESEIDYQKEGRFYEKGELVSKATYKDGKPYQGKIIIHDEYGSKTVSNYENGEKEGEEITYSSFVDEIVTRDFYHLGKQIFTEAYENNVISSKISIEDGMYNGEAIYFNSEGEEISKFTYKDNLPYEGELISVYGENSRETKNYKNGVLVENKSEIDGIIRLKKTLINEESQLYHIQNFSENGTIRYDFKAIEDTIEGEVMYYNEKGKLQNKALIKDGKLVSGTISLSILDSNYESPNYMLVTKKGEKYSAKVYRNEENTLLYESTIKIVDKKDDVNPLPLNLPITSQDLYPEVNNFEPDYY